MKISADSINRLCLVIIFNLILMDYNKNMYVYNPFGSFSSNLQL